MCVWSSSLVSLRGQLKRLQLLNVSGSSREIAGTGVLWPPAGNRKLLVLTDCLHAAGGLSSAAPVRHCPRAPGCLFNLRPGGGSVGGKIEGFQEGSARGEEGEGGSGGEPLLGRSSGSGLGSAGHRSNSLSFLSLVGGEGRPPSRGSGPAALRGRPRPAGPRPGLTALAELRSRPHTVFHTGP